MWNTLQKKYSHLSFDGGNTMKNKIAGTVAAGIAALLIPAVSVQAVTVNFGTAFRDGRQGRTQFLRQQF